MSDVKIVIRSIDNASQNIQGIGKTLESTLGVIKNSAAAALAAGVTFKQAFDLSQEGANVNQLTASFDRMNSSVFKTPDLLEEMSKSVRGTVKDTDLMASLLTLTAGASEGAAQSYAEAAPKLLEIAKAANALNPTLGDTAFMFDSLALGIKRGSPLILDNLGITVKVGEANEIYANQLGKAVEALTAEEKQMALLNAVMASGDTLIRQAGDGINAQADSWARLSVIIGEATDKFKGWMANQLMGVVGGGVGIFDQFAENADILNEALERGVITQEEFSDASNYITRGAYMRFVREAKSGIEELDGALALATTDSVAFGNSLDELNRMSREYSVVTGTSAVGAATAYGESLEELARMGRDAQQAQNALNREMNAATVSAIGAVDPEPIRDYLQAQEDLNNSYGEWVDVVITNSGEIGRVNEALAGDLTSEQKTAMQDILNTVEEGSAEWLAAYNALQGDLTETQRRELIAQRADLEASGDTFASVYTGNEEAQKAAIEAMKAAHTELINSFKELAFEGSLALAELSPDPEAVQRTIDYAVAIGYMTQEEADLRLEAANTRIEIEKLNEMVVKGEIEAPKAAAAFDLLAGGVYGTAEAALAAIDELANLDSSLSKFDGRHVTATVEVRQVGEIPFVPTGGTDKDEKGTGGASGGLIVGGLMGQDSVHILAMPGERLLSVEDNKRLMAGEFGGTNLTINAPVTINGSGGNTEELASAVSVAINNAVRDALNAVGKI